MRAKLVGQALCAKRRILRLEAGEQHVAPVPAYLGGRNGERHRHPADISDSDDEDGTERPFLLRVSGGLSFCQILY